MQQKGIVAVLRGRNAVFKAPILVFAGMKAIAPGFGGKRRIGDHEIEGLELAIGLLEERIGERVILHNLGRRAVVEDHVHLGECRRRVVHFLTVEGQVQAGTAPGFVMRLEQQRAGPAGDVVDGLVGAGGAADTDHPGHDARNLGGGIELPLTLARFGGEVAHQVLIGVAHDVVAFGGVALEVKPRRVENGNQVRQPVDHLLALAQFVGVVEVRDIDHAFEIVGLREPANELVDLVANLLVALEHHHVGEAGARRHVQEHVFLAAVFVGNIFHEQQDQDVIFVLRGIHSPAQLIAAFPERAIEF